jgi:hypothetical protein
VAPYVEPAKAQRLGLVTPATLGTHLEQSPPAAILTGIEKTGETLFEEYARTHGFTPWPLDEEGQTLWVLPR